MKLLIVAGVPLFMFYCGVVSNNSFWSMFMPGWAARIVSVFSCLTIAILLAWIAAPSEDLDK